MTTTKDIEEVDALIAEIKRLAGGQYAMQDACLAIAALMIRNAERERDAALKRLAPSTPFTSDLS